ncbi:hypothetical protein DQX05_07740 [Paenibacillus thiaminolyticus]|uniref:Uncharacterized protein n=1 Tax=Paenibacillus thiaminolyticus TaxID=49283 RepID=A0A3A3GQC7_PANTH|nr:hypothetical protein DQX05_07740 [Paenibacillus thiaminolyticus]
MLIPFLIIMTAITALTFIVLFLSKFFFKKTHTVIKLAYLGITLAICGIVHSLLYGDGVQGRHNLVLYSMIILAMIIVISRTKKKP